MLPEAAGRPRRWLGYSGAWLGIGTAPGALLVGAGLAARHHGTIPLASLGGGLLLIAALVWVQGHVGLHPPLGEGGGLIQLTPRYFTPAMGRIVAALIALGMTGWYGVNVGMGASALSLLLAVPRWLTAFVLGVPIALLALRGIRGWNWLATVTTTCALVLVGLILWRYQAASAAATMADAPADVAADLAVMLGYVGVFSLRAPDFTAGLAGRPDLNAVTALLIVPLAAVVFAGAVLAQRSGSSDVFTVLAGSGGLAFGNLLIALAVIAPTFTTFHSGAPTWRIATGIGERQAMLLMTAIGLTLAALHFDSLLLPWLSALGAILPPVAVPLVTEFLLRRRGRSPRPVPVWPWLAGALVAAVLVVVRSPLAMLAGFLITGAGTLLWRLQALPAAPAGENI